MNGPSPVTEKMLREREREVLGLFCKIKPPMKLIVEWARNENNDLQDWVCNNFKPEYSYATGIEVIESAERIAHSQIDNGLECLEPATSERVEDTQVKKEKFVDSVVLIPVRGKNDKLAKKVIKETKKILKDGKAKKVR